MVKEKSVLAKQIGKFASVGVLNTLIDVGVLNFLLLVVGFTAILNAFGFPFVVANIISVFLATTNSYFWNKYWTFQDHKEKNVVKQFGEFIFLSVVGMAINTIIFSFLFKVWTVPAEFAFSIIQAIGLDRVFTHDFTMVNFAKAWGIGFAMTWNFIAYKKWAFKA